MLNLRLVRGPLEDRENTEILFEYNRLTRSRIPPEEFRRWVQDGPAGPAWHALLQTDEGRTVGHTSLIPLRAALRGLETIPAKSEYSFTHEDFRATTIRGFEKVARPKFLILVDQLFRHCQGLGWGPFFVSTAEANHPLSRRVGCRAAEFPLWECVLILRPWNAARHTPNLQPKQRAAFFAAGVPQRLLASGISLALRSSNGVRGVPIASECKAEACEDRLAFFEEHESMAWRYFEGQYMRFAFDGDDRDYLIVKRGALDRYLRVCQWRLNSTKSLPSLLAAMIRLARVDGAVGVRWAVYDGEAMTPSLLRAMRRFGFFCVRRTRTVMIHTKDPKFLAPAMWKMNDSFFSFDP
jgi:hypothetical protein